MRFRWYTVQWEGRFAFAWLRASDSDSEPEAAVTSATGSNTCLRLRVQQPEVTEFMLACLRCSGGTQLLSAQLEVAARACQQC